MSNDDGLVFLRALGTWLDEHPTDVDWAIERLLKVRDRRGRMVEMVPNRVQREYSRTCGRRNIELKAHMRWLIGTGNEGKMQEIEERVHKHEAYLQRMGGLGAAFGVLLTLIHLAIDYLKVH